MAGRPRKLTVDQVEKALTKYMSENGERPTISGFCLELGIDRDTILAWQAESNGFSGIARKVIHTFTRAHEARLFDSKGGAAAGSIFWLKCHKWRDTDPAQTKVEAQPGANGGISVTITCTQPGIDV